MTQNDHEGIDWRVRTVTHLAKEMPAAYPGGPSHEAGALVVQQSLAKDADGHLVSFASPSATALALSLAVKAAHRARRLHQGIVYSQVVSLFGRAMSVKEDSLSQLYDYLEECMTVLTFSFQALEAFCNEIISLNIHASFTFKRKKGNITGTAEELERALSTDEKLGRLLPEVLSQKSPSGTKLWEECRELKESRDASIHIKSRDLNPRVQHTRDLNDATLFHQFLGANPLNWVRAAVGMMDYFMVGEDPPIWLDKVKQEADFRPRPRSATRTGSGMRPRGKR